MQLNTSRFFSDRLVFNDALVHKFRIANTFWDWCKRMISWVFSPSCYTDENRKTVHCFKKYLIDRLGQERLQKISRRYSLNLDQMEREGSPLLSRDVAKFVIGAQNVAVEDIPDFEKLSAQELDLAIEKARDPFQGIWKVAEISAHISGRATEFWARTFYDPFLADRERIQLCNAHPTIKKFNHFLHHMASLVIKREMDVGTIVPAPNREDGVKQHYIVRGKLVTGEGMVSYILDPATRDTNLPSIRLFRGTAPRNSEIDGISTVITDFEKDLGRTAHESGLPYEAHIQPKPRIEAGHSLGGNLVQWRAATLDHVQDAYCFCSPGIPVEQVNAFNAKNRPLNLVIRQVEGDRPSRVGGAHLGWRYPGAVDFKVKQPVHKLRYNPHVAVFGVENVAYTVKTISSPAERDQRLYTKGNFVEKVRSACGPIAAVVLRAIRKLSRALFSSRAQIQQGLQLGSFKNGNWQVERFGPFPYNRKA